MKDDCFDIIDEWCGSPHMQGDVGEVLTASALRRDLGLDVIRNVYLPVGDKFTEIDIIALSEFGVFVIENKNYGGVISGSKNAKFWRISYGLFHEERLSNPIHQNEFHKKCVLALLEREGYSNIPIFRPVIFNDKAKLDVKGISRDVFTLDSFKESYSKLESCNLGKLSSCDKSSLAKLFRNHSNVSDAMKLVHIYLLKRGEGRL